MRDVIRFMLGNDLRELRDVSPTLTVLEYLHTVEYLCGTKKGCAEGNCSACTVVLSERDGDAMRHRAVSACILFVPAPAPISTMPASCRIAARPTRCPKPRFAASADRRG